MLVLKIRKADNIAAGWSRLPSKPEDTDTHKYVQVSDVELGAFQALQQEIHNSIENRRDIIVGGSPGAYTFTAGTDSRHRIRFDQTAYQVQAGGSLSITFSLVNDAGAVRTGVTTTTYMECPPDTFGHQERVLKIDLVNGTVTRNVVMPDSGVFTVRSGPNWRAEEEVNIRVWE